MDKTNRQMPSLRHQTEEPEERVFILPYAILPERRAIRVKHFALDDTWWKRGMSPSERGVREIENVLRMASGLQHLYRRHNHRHNFVEFRISAKAFNAAACALRITYTADPMFERRLMEYPD